MLYRHLTIVSLFHYDQPAHLVHLTIVSLFHYDQPAHLVPNWPDAHIQLLWVFYLALPICKILAFTKCSSILSFGLLFNTNTNKLGKCHCVLKIIHRCTNSHHLSGLQIVGRAGCARARFGPPPKSCPQ